MSTFSQRPLAGDQEVKNITIDDDLLCNSGSFTTLSAPTANITNCTVTSLITGNLRAPAITGGSEYLNNLTASSITGSNCYLSNITIQSTITGSQGYFSNLIVPNITGTAIIGNIHVDTNTNRLWFYNGSGWK